MSGINLAILWTECFNKHNNLDILSFKRKNNVWLKIIFLKTLQFLYFRTEINNFLYRVSQKTMIKWTIHQIYFIKILGIIISINWSDHLNEILGLDEIIHDYFFAFHHHFPFKFDQKKVLKIYLCYHVFFQKKSKTLQKYHAWQFH